MAPALDDAAQSADEVAKATERMAGVYMDTNGKLRDAAGKFYQGRRRTQGLADTSSLTAEQISS